MYFNRKLNNCIYQQYKHFPSKELKNLVICVSGVGVTKEFTAIISDVLPDLELIGKSQCFPLYIYEEKKTGNYSLFDANSEDQFVKRERITDFILDRAIKQYGKTVSKEDIFYYVYGFLHIKDYREAFASDLKKMLPRLPLVEAVKDFWKFSKAGRKLAELHINYESVPTYKGVKVKGLESRFYKVEKMRFPKKGQKDAIIFNSKITISGIPD